MTDTTIEWATKVWNPVRGCARVSAGCVHCYAERQAARFSGPGLPYEGLVRVHTKPDGRREPRWTGDVGFFPEKLAEPLSWRKHERCFVNSMSDLFHERLAFEQIAAVFGVMAACPHIDFLVLTKRPERARDFMRWVDVSAPDFPTKRDNRGGTYRAPIVCVEHAWTIAHPWVPDMVLEARWCDDWPLPNVWLGVSVEDQAAADERIPMLLDTPAAVRWVSYEPALGPVDFAPLWCARHGSEHVRFDPPAQPWCIECDEEIGHAEWLDSDALAGRRLDWIVVGGESGPGARPFAIEWAARTIAQCRTAGVPVFVKQLGALTVTEERPGLEPGTWGWSFPRWADRKGGDPAEWPADLRVREFPEVRR